MVRLKDIAELVGVSISTVSRVINQDTSRSVNPETRKKIWDAANELGYKPNHIARQLVKGKQEASQLSKRIGCIVAVPQNKYNHPYFSFILEGIEKGLVEQGYYLSFIHTAEDLKNPTILHKTVHENDLDGMILVEGLDTEIYDYLKKNIPYIVGIDISDPHIPRVSYDRVAAARIAVRHLIEQGHQDIGYIGGLGLSGKLDKEKRFRGFKYALEEAGLELNMDWVLNTDWDVDLSYKLMSNILNDSSLPRPTAMYAASDMMAISAMKAVVEQGLRVPEDIAFIGLDNIDFSQYTAPSLSTIHVPKYEIGNIAAKVIVDYINGRYTVPIQFTVPFELIVRQSSNFKR